LALVSDYDRKMRLKRDKTKKNRVKRREKWQRNWDYTLLLGVKIVGYGIIGRKKTGARY
jgi:hypothetical protein